MNFICSSFRLCLRFAVSSATLVSAVLAVAVLTEQVASAAVPVSVTATATASGSVTVSWTSPTDTVAASDYSYTVRYRAGSSGSYSVVQTGPGVTSGIINQLTGGTTYEIKVTATPQVGTNRGTEGCSRVSSGTCDTDVSLAPGTSITAQEVPAAPTIGSATASSGQIEVAFTAGDLRGSTLSQYTATCGSVTATGASTPITVAGLTNGIAYTCTVKAGSNQGDSASSASSSSATPSGVPDTMSAPSVSAGDGQATFSWTSVAATTTSGVDPDVVDDGGLAISGYTVMIVNSATGAEVTTSSPLSTDDSGTVTGLTNGTAYKAKILATNANGNGEYSSLSSAFTPAVGGGISDPIIAVVTQPAAVDSGTVFTAAPKVSLAAAGVTVTATISSGSGTLSNATAVSGSDFTATFSSLTIAITGSTATLRLSFAASGYQSATSSSFVVTKSSGGGSSGGGSSGGGSSDSSGGGSTSTVTTLPRVTTSPATPNTATPTATQPTNAPSTSVKIPKGYGAPVSAPTPPAAFATGAAVATKAGSVVAVLDAPNLSGKTRIVSYKIVLTPTKGKSVSKVARVPSNGAPVTAVLTATGGTYKMQVSALRFNGKSAGTWTIPNLVVKKR